MNTVHILQLLPLAEHSTAVWRPLGLKPSPVVTCFFAGKAGIRCCSETTGHVCFAGGAQHQKGLYNKVQFLKTQYVVEVRKDQPVSTAKVV